MSKKRGNKSEQTGENDSTDSEGPQTNEELEAAMVAAQWEQAKRLGLLEQHPDSINDNGPA